MESAANLRLILAQHQAILIAADASSARDRTDQVREMRYALGLAINDYLQAQLAAAIIAETPVPVPPKPGKPPK
jgi:hypothetical protein